MPRSRTELRLPFDRSNLVPLRHGPGSISTWFDETCAGYNIERLSTIDRAGSDQSLIIHSINPSMKLLDARLPECPSLSAIYQGFPWKCTDP
jgi:hypothetical protein